MLEASGGTGGGGADGAVVSNNIGAKLGGIFNSPISSMSGVALFIIAGSRLSYAIVAACALVWVSMISAFINMAPHGVKSKARIQMLNVLISSFAGSIYLFLLYLLNPLLAMETTLICMLAPVFYMGSKFCVSLESAAKNGIFSESLFELLALGGLTLVFSLIREPLGFATLTVPDGNRGIMALFNTKDQYPYPIQLISSSTGALFLLAYIMVILRYINAGAVRRTKDS
ncbi:MAG: hypothetical protein LBJ35_04795 [Spirochaetaceae bacterium]|jgi:hypothetical protein|nr:hypothetical protein [Spirochaetaceae bacterium]